MSKIINAVAVLALLQCGAGLPAAAVPVQVRPAVPSGGDAGAFLSAVADCAGVVIAKHFPPGGGGYPLHSFARGDFWSCMLGRAPGGLPWREGLLAAYSPVIDSILSGALADYQAALVAEYLDSDDWPSPRRAACWSWAELRRMGDPSFRPSSGLCR